MVQALQQAVELQFNVFSRQEELCDSWPREVALCEHEERRPSHGGLSSDERLIAARFLDTALFDKRRASAAACAACFFILPGKSRSASGFQSFEGRSPPVSFSALCPAVAWLQHVARCRDHRNVKIM